MKIIRRKRTVTIQTCAFRQWQSDGQDGSFSCPNCGKTFQQNAELNAAIEKVLPSIVDEPREVRALPAAPVSESSCEGKCNE